MSSVSLPENNRQEITALISYINNTLLPKLVDQERRLDELTVKLTSLQKPPKFSFYLTDSEDEIIEEKKRKKTKPLITPSKTNTKKHKKNKNKNKTVT